MLENQPNSPHTEKIKIRLVETPTPESAGEDIERVSTEIPSQPAAPGQDEKSAPAESITSTNVDTPPAMYLAPFRKKPGLAHSTKSELKQIFNVVYFSIAFVSIYFLGTLWGNPLLVGAAIFLAIFAITSCALLVRSKASHRVADIDLNSTTRKTIRAVALITPMPLIATAAFLGPAEYEYQKGVELNHQKNYGQAVFHLCLANALGPPSVKKLNELSLSYNRINDRNNALYTAETALELDPNDPEALAQKSWALDATGRSAEAVDVALRAIARDNVNGIAYGSLAYAYYHLGDLDKAQDAATTHINLHPDEWTAYNLRANIYERMGQKKLALADRAREELLKARDAKEFLNSPHPGNDILRVPPR